nr:hypothetical protein [Tanacetum cinerariifolium]
MKESTKNDPDNNDESNLSGSMVESPRIKKVKKFYFVTEDGKHIHLPEEQINKQKKIEDKAKADAVNVKEPLDKLNGLANKKRKHDDDIHDYFKANKRLQSSVQCEKHLPGTVLNEPVVVHIKLPDDDYVAPVTSPTLDKQLNEFREECSDITWVNDKANGTLLKIYRNSQILRHMIVRPFFWKLLHQVMDMSKVDKIKVKRTKPGTIMKKVQEIKAEGEFISNLIPLILYPK